MSTPDSAPAGDLLTLRALAKAIGVDAGQLFKESRRPGFPSHAMPEGATLFNPAEVLTWRLANVRQKKRIDSPAVDRPTPTPAMPAAAAPRPAQPTRSAPSPRPAIPAEPPASEQTIESEDADLLQTLYSTDATPLEVSRAVVRLVSRNVARSHKRRELYPAELDALKKSLQELRTAEAGYIDLGKQSGDLIPRDQVKMIVGDLCNRMVRALGSFENTIATEFSIWLADPDVAAMTQDDRTRKIRAFVKQTTAAVRNHEADEIDELIVNAADDEDQ